MSEQVKEFGLTIPIYNDFVIIQSHKDNLPDNLALPEFADAGFWRDKDGNLHIWLSKNINKWRTITHECVHIANRILSERNVVYYPEQDETLAYLDGNLIYEGDKGILIIFGAIGPNGGFVDADKTVVVRVEWVDECACFLFVDDKDNCYDMINSSDNFEIIGNIHEQKKQK